MASRSYRTEAIVLKTLDLGEADRILTLLTRHFGKVRVVAKGIRKPLARLAGYAEPLTHGTFQLARGRNLDVLTGAESRAHYATLRGDLVSIAAGWYVAELADRFTADHLPAAPIFDLVENALRHLDAGHGAALVCRWFDLHLLDRSGFRPEVIVCVNCSGSLVEGQNAWSSAAGGALCPSCVARAGESFAQLSLRALKSLRYLLASDFASASRLRVDAPLAAEIERHLRGSVHQVIDRDVVTARFQDEIARLPRRSPVLA